MAFPPGDLGAFASSRCLTVSDILKWRIQSCKKMAFTT
jgi:hypothetical protein